MRKRRSRAWPILADHALVDVELQTDGVIANRVHDEVQVFRVTRFGHAIEIFLRVDEQTTITGGVVERLEHCRGVRPE